MKKEEGMIIFRKIYYWLKIVWLSFKWVFRTNLGNKVIYRGQKYIIINGVCHGEWKLSPIKGYKSIEVKRGECKKVVSLNNYWYSFISGYKFYMASWYSIWVREGIKPWMKGCRIW